MEPFGHLLVSAATPWEDVIRSRIDRNRLISQAGAAIEAFKERIEQINKMLDVSERHRIRLKQELQFAMHMYQNGRYKNIPQRLRQVQVWVEQPVNQHPPPNEHQDEQTPDIALNSKITEEINLVLKEMKSGGKRQLDLVAYECFANCIRRLMHEWDIFGTKQAYPGVRDLPYLYECRRLGEQGYTPPGDDPEQWCTWERIQHHLSLLQTGVPNEVYTVVQVEPYHLLTQYSGEKLAIRVYSRSAHEYLVQQLHSGHASALMINNGSLWREGQDIGEFFPEYECKSYIEVPPRPLFEKISRMIVLMRVPRPLIAWPGGWSKPLENAPQCGAEAHK